MVLKKKFLGLKFFSLILAENLLFFPDFPNWKFSKFCLISLIGGNPGFIKWQMSGHRHKIYSL